MGKISITVLFLVCLSLFVASNATHAAPFATGQDSPGPLRVTDLRCEFGADPMGVDREDPRLSWKLKSGGRNQRQAAYQVVAVGLHENLWNSGKIVSGQTQQIAYAGARLNSADRVTWRVRVWDRNGLPSAWSAASHWTMGIVAAKDWHSARWIGASPAPTDAALALLGYHAAEAPHENDVKWVQVDLGAAFPISTIRLFPMRHADRDGFGFPLRFRVEASATADFREPVPISDQEAADFPNPGVNPVSFDAHRVAARFVRVTATKLWLRDTVYAFALHRLEVDSNGINVARSAHVTAKDSVEAYGWGAVALTASLPAPGKLAATDSLLLRRQFTVRRNLTRALAYACGLGQYEMYVNGSKVGRDVLAPGWTKYDKTCLYDTRDITAQLGKGPNAIGLLLGNGMYNVHAGRYTKFVGTFGPQKAICEVVLQYADGTSETVVTDDSWHVAPGPITFSSVFGGEDYDARLAAKGWDTPAFDDSAWSPATLLSGPGGQLRGFGSAAPLIRTFETLTPTAVRRLAPDTSVYDLGQNAAIMPRLMVSGPAGSVVRITPAELLNADGSVDRGSVGGGAAYWQYTLSGSGNEEYFPKFFYHGCRYLQVTLTPPDGAGARPTILALAGVVIGSDSPSIGRFTCSSELFNKINTLVRWAQRSNMVSLMTDCPHRERLGWIEQDHLNGPSLRYDFDLNQLFRKSENDMADSQTSAGLVPSIAPEYPVFSGGFRDSPEWGSAFLLVPFQQYQFTGDLSLLSRYYEPMKHYMAYLTSKAKENILDYGLGDWYDIGPRAPGYSQLTPIPLTATAFYYQDAVVLARTAALLGRSADASRYDSLSTAIKTAFNQRFWNAETGQYATGSQCANSIPLVMGIAAPADRPRLVEAIAADVRKHGMADTAGDVGYRYLLKALAEGGRSDVIFAMNNQSDKPGYGFQLKMGATSLTEAWDAGRGSSQNHFMLGQIVEWFYSELAGIEEDPAGPGFQRIVIKPAIVGDLTSAGADYESVRGTISSHWKRNGAHLALTVTIPPNTGATVYVPARVASSVLESGKSASRSEGVRYLRRENETNVYNVGSGTFVFTSD